MEPFENRLAVENDNQSKAPPAVQNMCLERHNNNYYFIIRGSVAMKCGNCGHIFNGNFCPKCGTKAVNEAEKTIEENKFGSINQNEENPYEQSYSDSQETRTPEAPSYTTPPVAPSYNQNVYQNNNQQNTVNVPYQYQQYQQIPPKKPMTGGKIAATVVGIVLAVVVLIYIVPFGFIICVSTIDNAGSEFITSQDLTAVYSTDETVDMGDFSYSVDNISYTDTYGNDKAGDGYEFLKVDVIIKNTSDISEYVDAEINLYTDDFLYESFNSPDPNRYLDVGKSEIVTYVYKIPKQRESVELSFSVTDDFANDRNFRYQISE